jgi:hypothetical protein
MKAINAAATELIVGAPMAGGFFAGTFRIGDDFFGLVVSPRAVGDIVTKWNDSNVSVPGAESYCDGFANTEALAAAGSPLAKWARSLDIDGRTDWYIASRDEEEVMYRNLKPTDQLNYCSFRDGDNPSSIPLGYPYTADLPAQTSIEAFREGGAEAFECAWYWTSTQHAAYPDCAWGQDFGYGDQGYYRKTFEGRARAVRRFAL